jgi:hypothetical protein
LGQIRKNLILWAALIAVIALDAVSYPLGRFFTLIDLAYLAAIILVMNNRVFSAYAVAITAACIKDSLAMPFFGMHLASGVIGLAAVQLMCSHFFTDKYTAKVLIIAAGEAARCAAQGLIVFIFYWGFKMYFVPLEVFLKILMTALAGAAVMKIAEAGEGRFKKWLKKISRKT